MASSLPFPLFCRSLRISSAVSISAPLLRSPCPQPLPPLLHQGPNVHPRRSSSTAHAALPSVAPSSCLASSCLGSPCVTSPRRASPLSTLSVLSAHLSLPPSVLPPFLLAVLHLCVPLCRLSRPLCALAWVWPGR